MQKSRGRKSILTTEFVAELKAAWDEGLNLSQIAAKFSISWITTKKALGGISYIPRAKQSISNFYKTLIINLLREQKKISYIADQLAVSNHIIRKIKNELVADGFIYAPYKKLSAIVNHPRLAEIENDLVNYVEVWEVAKKYRVPTKKMIIFRNQLFEERGLAPASEQILSLMEDLEAKEKEIMDIKKREVFFENYSRVGVVDNYKLSLAALYLEENGINAEKVKERYRTLSRALHPDHGGDQLIMSTINKAYGMVMSRF